MKNRIKAAALLLIASVTLSGCIWPFWYEDEGHGHGHYHHDRGYGYGDRHRY
jgi:hypothetical protein